ncbi:hypothetical protein EV643_12559 [Kribbella sp. VKM Ac-2527]|uniref:Uncharacterized protein n=1 Tax=Kribbella caucasensis TaxID=2512215 RepID=A0A4R6JGI4_9ACTN|nr:hypothetical protein EV643_12559 [Kribbella sp. VKM Ac-2527]
MPSPMSRRAREFADDGVGIAVARRLLSCRGGLLRVAKNVDYVEALLSQAGLESRRYEAAPGRVNLIALGVEPPGPCLRSFSTPTSTWSRLTPPTGPRILSVG